MSGEGQLIYSDQYKDGYICQLLETLGMACKYLMQDQNFTTVIFENTCSIYQNVFARVQFLKILIFY